MRRQITTAIAVAGFVLGPGGAVAGAQPGVDTNTHAGQPAPHGLRETDPRSPDARDAENVLVVPAGVIAKSTPPAAPKADDGGLGLDEAALGAGGVALVALLALGAGKAVQARRPRAA